MSTNGQVWKDKKWTMLFTLKEGVVVVGRRGDTREEDEEIAIILGK